MADKLNDDLSISNLPFSEQILDDVLLTDNSSESSVKNLSNEPIIKSTSSDISIIENSLNVNSVDR